MTQEEVARSAKLTAKFVSQIENDRVNPSVDVLRRLVEDAFGVSLGAFFLWDPDRADISAMLALLARQSTEHHRRIVRAVEVLCDHDATADAADD
jgi:transcriptional regulator with XRE-family HTH domain